MVGTALQDALRLGSITALSESSVWSLLLSDTAHRVVSDSTNQWKVLHLHTLVYAQEVSAGFHFQLPSREGCGPQYSMNFSGILRSCGMFYVLQGTHCWQRGKREQGLVVQTRAPSLKMFYSSKQTLKNMWRSQWGVWNFCYCATWQKKGELFEEMKWKNGRHNSDEHCLYLSCLVADPWGQRHMVSNSS